jgi:adenylate cyclase
MAPSAPTILIIEDQEDFAELLRLRVDANGYEAAVALSGAEGLEKAAEMVPSLILLDIMMPVMNGLEVLRRLKEDDKTRDIPVIVVTAKGDAKVVFEARRLGSKGFLVKPCQPADLLREIRQHIRR